MRTPPGDDTGLPALDLGNLQAWYRRVHRRLPWRETRDPWAIWVSEVMLQQTRVETVIGRFGPFLRRFPDPAALARAPEDEALKAWEGMGYYARCRHLRTAATIVTETYGGRVPPDRETLRSLPGIGRSTAGAILSFAFGQREPVLDGNVRRVVVRLLDVQEDPSAARVQARLWEAVTAWVARAPDPALHNQAMMELGALVCLPRNPDCGQCPLALGCLARARGTARGLPSGRSGRRVPSVEAAVAVIRDREGRIYLQRRPSRGLLGGLWELPGGKRDGDESPERTVVREVLEETGFRIASPRPVALVRHAYTHFRVLLHAFEAHLPEDRPVPPARSGPSRWVSPEEIEEVALPEATRKVLQVLRLLPREEGRAGVEAGPRPRTESRPTRAARAVQDQPKRSPKRA